MERIWYLKFDKREDGPYSTEEVGQHPYATLNTLAWKEGFNDWYPIREIPELRILFDEEDEPPPSLYLDDEIVLDNQKEPSFYLLFLLILLILISYLIFILHRL